MVPLGDIVLGAVWWPLLELERFPGFVSQNAKKFSEFIQTFLPGPSPPVTCPLTPKSG